MTPLPHERELLVNLERNVVIAAIIERRWTIRDSHRDQKGDDRCWVDDYFIYEFLDDSPCMPTTMIPVEVAMNECKLFYEHRRADIPDSVPHDAILDPAEWDRDLDGKDWEHHLNTLVALQKAALRFRNIRLVEKRAITIDDDRALYSILPEKIPADFCLPSEEEFLGEALAPRAGCPAFWRGHLTLCAAGCKHNFHKKGPCSISE